VASGSRIRKGARSISLAPRLAALLVEARGARTRREMAADLGVAPATLADLELGHANPTLAYLEALGSAYGVEFDLVARPRRAHA
jgi:transcriptional regulator with XRE-family HTH domain